MECRRIHVLRRLSVNTVTDSSDEGEKIMTDTSSTSSDDNTPPEPILGRCNAQKRQGPAGGLCKEWAGKGTDHVGTGRCRRHGGCAPTGRRAAVREYVADQHRRFGQPIAISPTAALRDEVGRTAGLIATIEAEIDRTVDETGQPILVDTSGLHPGPAPLVALHHAERRHLVQAARAAVDAGVETVMADLQEAYQDRALGVVEAVVVELGHDPDDPQVVDAIGRALARLAGDKDRPAIGGVA